MTMPLAGAHHWSPSKASPSALAAPEAWHATRAQTSLATQIHGDKNEYLAAEKGEIGRIIGPNERELFVSCDAGPALQQQFESVHPEFIVVHDIGTTSSRKLLRGLAAASGRALQKLVIRRQGYGQALATLFFLEMSAANGQLLRMYTTQADTDAATRKSVARMLLAFSRLGVVMVGNVSAQLLQPELNAIRDDIAAGPWHNRQLLLLPLASASNLVALGVDLADRTGIMVRTTPVVSRPAEAWGFISDTWKHLYSAYEPEPASSSSGAAALIPELAVAHAASPQSWSGSTFASTSSGLSGYPSVLPATNGHGPEAPMRPVARPRPVPVPVPVPVAQPVAQPAPQPAVARQAPEPALALNRGDALPSAMPVAPRASEIRAAAPTVKMGLAGFVDSVRPEQLPQLTVPAQGVEQGMLQRYVRLLSALNGMRSCCVFDVGTGARLAHSGNFAGSAELGRQGQMLLAMMASASKALGSGEALPEAAITLETHHLLLRGVPKHPQAALHAVFDKATANLTLARLQVLRLDALFEDAPRGA
jgi:hypothetical protein